MRPDQTPQLMQQITEHVGKLAQATDAARMSEEMTRYLGTLGRFHRYSIFNTYLIMMACPEATMVAGFHAWHKFNRFVRKGEHGIPILAPIVIPEKEEDGTERKSLRGFKVVYVFDLSQTEGEPMPEPPDWKSPEKDSQLMGRLLTFAIGRGILVSEAELPGEMQGVSKGGIIELAPKAGTVTLIHELAHELMHKRPDAPQVQSVRELEAEAVAFVVARHFGLGSTGSPNYVALHGASSALILGHLERVRATAAEIIQAVEAAGAAIIQTVPPQADFGCAFPKTITPTAVP